MFRIKKLTVFFWFIITILNTVGCIRSNDIDDRNIQKKYFINRFNISLPDDIVDIKIKDHFIRDSWILFMKFSYSDSLFQQILHSNFDTPKDSLPKYVIDDANHHVYENYGSKPEWFDTPTDSVELFYGSGLKVEEGGWDKSSEAIWKDPKNNCIYYLCSAVDF
ncbi:MAG: hypothetical protein H6607_02690 [Flavobacteriales bacterium]|nr:hypothetical protein [Flavobacteriales bacterium]